MLTITQVESKDQAAAVQELLREYMAWTNTLGVDNSQAPTFQGFEEEVATLPDIYSEPDGRWLLAVQDEQPAGCIFLKIHDETTCELKRFYVRPRFRGRQIGWYLVQMLVDEARQSGFKRIVLDSHVSMKKAHRLYQAVGFKTVATPVDFPEDLKPFVVFMECTLAAAIGDGS